ncbi:MAG: hypothetical protein K6D96_03230 [Acetatifactor sp.]|nr:hypothetical protein [Acetatifactor sp.]
MSKECLLPDTVGGVLEFWQSMGCEDAVFYVDDIETCSFSAAYAIVREDNDYMDDYVTDDTGRIAQVRLDKVAQAQVL